MIKYFGINLNRLQTSVIRTYTTSVLHKAIYRREKRETREKTDEEKL